MVRTKLEDLLKKFDLDEKEIEIYLVLLEKGDLGATDISRETDIPKTTVYRTIEDLVEKRLVNVLIGESGRSFQAESPENLKSIINERREELQELENTLPEVVSSIASLSGKKVKKSEIKYYSGINGLKQITWNSSKAQGLLRIFEIENMSSFLNKGFAEKARLEFVRNGVEIHEITNEREFGGWTNVKDLVENYWQVRYVDPQELSMEFEMLVYNDVFAMYNYIDDEIFGVEIRNSKLAAMQKQIFDFIWLKGQKMETYNNQGASRLRN